MKKGIIKKITTYAACAALLVPTTVGLTACGNMDMMDMHYTFHYVVIEENGEHVLHKVNKWADSESESVTISTQCCDNYIWTSSNRAVLYEKKPEAAAYDRACSQESE